MWRRTEQENIKTKSIDSSTVSVGGDGEWDTEKHRCYWNLISIISEALSDMRDKLSSMEIGKTARILKRVL